MQIEFIKPGLSPLRSQTNLDLLNIISDRMLLISLKFWNSHQKCFVLLKIKMKFLFYFVILAAVLVNIQVKICHIHNQIIVRFTKDIKILNFQSIFNLI